MWKEACKVEYEEFILIFYWTDSEAFREESQVPVFWYQQHQTQQWCQQTSAQEEINLPTKQNKKKEHVDGFNQRFLPLILSLLNELVLRERSPNFLTCPRLFPLTLLSSHRFFFRVDKKTDNSYYTTAGLFANFGYPL